MEHPPKYILTQLPNEILLLICSNLPSTGLYKCIQVSQALKGISQYILEHKRKVRFVDDNLRVIFVSQENSGKTSVINRLLKKEPVLKSTEKERVVTYKLDWAQHTLSRRGREQTITLIDPPTARVHRAQVWCEAFTADLCVLVVRAFGDYVVKPDSIEQLIVGTCHMMSSREVIVAVNLGEYYSERVYQKYNADISKVLKKTIGPLFDVVPVSAERDKNITGNPFAWYKGPTLASLIKRSQQQTSWHEVAVERLRSEKFEMQFVFKQNRGRFNCTVTGRVTSGTLVLEGDDLPQVRLLPTEQLFDVRSMQMRYKQVQTIEAGDVVGLHFKTIFTSVRKKWGFALDPTVKTVDMTRAFRVKLFVAQQSMMDMYGHYRVFYGGSRFPCLLWWIFPDEKTPPTPLKKMRNVTAIMVPLILMPMQVYQPTEFQKNYSGKVMLTMKNTVVAVGRIDRVLNEEMPVNHLAHRQYRYDESYAYIRENGAALFKENEAAIQKQFLEYIERPNAREVVTSYVRYLHERRE